MQMSVQSQGSVQKQSAAGPNPTQHALRDTGRHKPVGPSVKTCRDAALRSADITNHDRRVSVRLEDEELHLRLEIFY